jgi:type IV pilus assembly protein PilA
MKAIRNSKGFTLIELLVVVAIIGILAAIAIPQFALYRARGFTSRAASDAHNICVGEEAVVADGGAYLPCGTGTCQTTLPGMKESQGVTSAVTVGVNSFAGTTSHPNGCPIAAAGNVTFGSATGGVSGTLPVCL